MVWRATLLSLLFGGAAAVVAFAWLDADPQALTRIPLWAVTAGVGWVLVNYACGGVRIVLLSHRVGHPVGMLRATRAYILGLFSAAVSPGGAGQAPAVVLTLMTEGMTASQAWSVAIYVWVLDLTLLAWAVPLSAALVGSALPLGWELVAVGLLAGAGFLAIGYLLAYRLLWLRRSAFGLFGWRPLRRWRRGLMRFFARLANATRLMTRQPWPLQLTLHALTTLLYLATYLVFVTLIRALGSDASALSAIAAVLLPSVLSFLFPTPGGSGFIELSAATLFRAQASAEAVATAVVGWRLLTYYSRFVMGAALGGPVLMNALQDARRPNGAADDPT